VRNSSCIGPGLKIKGEIAGYEDLQIDGNVEGTIDLQGQKLTVGRSGQLNCRVDAREVLVYGKVVGNLRASDLIEIKRDASVVGDIRAARISIEDGAHFKGYSDMERPHVPTPANRTPIVPTDGATN
jgi:cytoskeletal protein CcmA (bactofilin family)